MSSIPKKINPQTLFFWVYFILPRLWSWTSTYGRVIVLGNVEHAIPPTAGQSASQAFKNTYTFALLVVKGWRGEGGGLDRSIMKGWRNARQEGVNSVIAPTKNLNNTKLPEAEKAKLGENQLWTGKMDRDLGWLYTVRMEE